MMFRENFENRKSGAFHLYHFCITHFKLKKKCEVHLQKQERLINITGKKLSRAEIYQLIY